MARRFSPAQEPASRASISLFRKGMPLHKSTSKHRTAPLKVLRPESSGAMTARAVATSSAQSDEEAPASAEPARPLDVYRPWAELLARTFAVDVLSPAHPAQGRMSCSRCQGARELSGGHGAEQPAGRRACPARAVEVTKPLRSVNQRACQERGCGSERLAKASQTNRQGTT